MYYRERNRDTGRETKGKEQLKLYNVHGIHCTTLATSVKLFFFK
jgi:hypothetical protein